MAGVGLHVYFDTESSEIIKSMNRGELSKICNQAVKEWGDDIEDIGIVREKLLKLKINNKKNAEKEIFLSKKFKILQEKERENTQISEKNKEVVAQEMKVKRQEKENKKMKIHVSALKKMFNVTDAEAKKYIKEYLSSKDKGGFRNYFIKRGLFPMEIKK